VIKSRKKKTSKDLRGKPEGKSPYEAQSIDGFITLK
jgi:hypothetical protein